MPNTRRVTINPTVKVHEVLTLYDYTASEISATWYDEHEMDKIARKLEDGNAKSGKYCIRGLETHTTLGSVSKRGNREAAKTAVLEEQARQWHAGNEETDVQTISDSYRCTTSSCQMWAQVVGSRDRQEVEAYLYDDDEEEENEEDQVILEKPAPSSTVVCSHSQESTIVLRAAMTASGIATVLRYYRPMELTM
ncbi:unnamed protein product [Cylindrotheca closterium]|uniref:Uncharacterized protein n=1 Tax=Cylindrotheca closterium TaxID=2856 RepID=A0AAD2FYI8_9STRA|nr:unnamed protein product [Cylindrotheca closterium]